VSITAVKRFTLQALEVAFIIVDRRNSRPYQIKLCRLLHASSLALFLKCVSLFC
jgi:hypothetical protein